MWLTGWGQHPKVRTPTVKCGHIQGLDAAGAWGQVVVVMIDMVGHWADIPCCEYLLVDVHAMEI